MPQITLLDNIVNLCNDCFSCPSETDINILAREHDTTREIVEQAVEEAGKGEEHKTYDEQEVECDCCGTLLTSDDDYAEDAQEQNEKESEEEEI